LGIDEKDVAPCNPFGMTNMRGTEKGLQRTIENKGDFLREKMGGIVPDFPLGISRERRVENEIGKGPIGFKGLDNKIRG